jgi:hypothetical protein
MRHTVPSSRGSTADTRQCGTSLAICALILSVTILAGCRGAAQTDIIQREMRQQEDEIYVMQDYVTQYQQMLCNARRENAWLRRQLAERQSVVPSTPPKEKAKGPPPWKPERAEGPAIEVPKSLAPPKTRPAEPEVPPLETTSQADQPAGATIFDDASPAADNELQFRVTSAEEPALEFRSQPAPGLAAVLPGRVGPPQHVWLDGEVIPGEGGDGARLLVDVEPLSADGGPATFRGALSLMVLDPHSEQDARCLARWDFPADKLRQEAEQVADGRAMRFRLQLPPEAAVGWPVELWARLVDDEAGKVLAHVGIDLNQPAHFSSIRQAASAGQHFADEAADNALAATRTIAQRPGWSEWKTAGPGESNLLAERTGRAEGQWRTAAEPPPAAALGLPSPATVTPAAAQSIAQAGAGDDRYAVPSEASGAAGRTMAAVPHWSPTR